MVYRNVRANRGRAGEQIPASTVLFTPDSQKDVPSAPCHPPSALGQWAGAKKGDRGQEKSLRLTQRRSLSCPPLVLTGLELGEGGNLAAQGITEESWGRIQGPNSPDATKRT